MINLIAITEAMKMHLPHLFSHIMDLHDYTTVSDAHIQSISICQSIVLAIQQCMNRMCFETNSKYA